MVKDLRSNSLNALQMTLRLTLLIFSVAIVCLYISILYLEKTYPRVDPHYPRKLVYICFPKQDSFVATYMGIIRTFDLVLSVFLAVQCVVLGISTSFPRLHWPISIICAVRFIFVLVEIVHISSFTGDTQLDFILSVSDGTCKVNENQITAFRALVAVFTLRCVKGYITINMATLAYGNSILIFLFGLRAVQTEAQPREVNDERQLDEMSSHHIHLTV
ncbi:G protein-coupled receptor [Caenorhabditis elegans]|uniref:G protein-coupled receptor n=1 Tax=Caenorhabditis elegans TaxID=6239 RepID=Q17888_CAEEL|nr:G protein-coupled receptor [Caenorhabditis elegans]CCD62402.2 G protein-coupled receptor [Caenorhabditis elegans]